jgi:hypothetical protein
MAPRPRAWYNPWLAGSPSAAPGGRTIASVAAPPQRPLEGVFSIMAKPHRRLKKANHGARPANSKARKAKRKHIRT